MAEHASRSSQTLRIVLVGAGTSVHLRQWALHLAAAGHEVHVCTLHPWDGEVPESVVVHRLPGRLPLGYATAHHALRRLVREVDADVVHAHYATGYGYLARRAAVQPLVVSVWGSDVFEFPDSSRWHRALLMRNLASAAIVCSTSRAMAERVVALGVDRGKVVVVPFGVDTTRFSVVQLTDRPALTVGTVKSLEPTYGIDVLIEAFAAALERLVADRHPLAAAARLVIVGEGSERARLGRIAASLGIRDRVELVGSVPHEEVPRRLRSMTVFANLSRRESFGVSVLEASSTGLPVVATRIDGLAEVVEHGETGLLVPPDDPPRAADALEQLMRDPALRARLGGNGAARVRSQFSWEHCVAAQLDVYRTVATRSAAWQPTE